MISAMSVELFMVGISADGTPHGNHEEGEAGLGVSHFSGSWQLPFTNGSVMLKFGNVTGYFVAYDL